MFHEILCGFSFLIGPKSAMHSHVKRDHKSCGCIVPAITSILFAFACLWTGSNRMVTFLVWLGVTAVSIFILIGYVVPYIIKFGLSIFKGGSPSISHLRFLLGASLLPLAISGVLTSLSLSDFIIGWLDNIGIVATIGGLAMLWGMIVFAFGLQALTREGIIKAFIMSIVAIFLTASAITSIGSMFRSRWDFALASYEQQGTMYEQPSTLDVSRGKSSISSVISE